MSRKLENYLYAFKQIFIDQSNRVLLNFRCHYDSRSLAMDIKSYFERSSDAIEVMILKGNKLLSINRRFAASPRFLKLFRSMYDK